jgi:hypothetical protein
MLENAIEATAHHPMPCWGNGDVLELTGSVHRGDGSKLHSLCSNNAAFYSSRINVVPATLVQSEKIGYHTIAQAGSFKGM